MASPRAIDMALDLARMPAFAPSMSVSPLPDDVLEVIRIAAGSPEACRAAALATGKPERVLVEAARFYLQQVLFSEDADCYRILGIRPDDSRASARDHMRWLLQWLHPDRNGGWDTVYATRIVNAWREVSNGASPGEVSRPTSGERRADSRTRSRNTRRGNSFRVPWIARPHDKASGRPKRSVATRTIRIMAVLVAILLLLGLTAPASTVRFISGLW